MSKRTVPTLVNDVVGIGLRGMHDGFRRASDDAGRVVRAFQESQPDDAVRSLIDLQISQRQVEASARVIRAGNELLGSVLNVYA